MFATALGKNQPDRSYFNSLYKFDPKKELGVYSLPFYDYTTGKAIPNASKMPSGVMSSTKLPPMGKEEVKEVQQEGEEVEQEEFEREEEENVFNESNFNRKVKSRTWKI